MRCQRQMKHGERVAAVKISSVRRKAARKFWAPQQDHAALRMDIAELFVGRGDHTPLHDRRKEIFSAPVSGSDAGDETILLRIEKGNPL